MSYQFLHIEAYGRKGAHKKNSSVRRSSMFDIRDEMIRMPHACSHVAESLPPLVLFGMKPEDTFVLTNERAGHAIDKRARKLRCDAPVVIAGVASWPKPVVDVKNDPEKKRYQQWREETLAWLKRRWGDDLKTVLQHLDEAYPHLHFIVVPKLSPDCRLRISSIHPGHRAAEKTAEAGGTGRDQKKAYKEAMAALQDGYYERVSVRFGILRTGPRRQRLTRAEWTEKKASSRSAGSSPCRCSDVCIQREGDCKKPHRCAGSGSR
ncbi:MAG: plasmid recombination protein [Afipia sp.]